MKIEAGTTLEFKTSAGTKWIKETIITEEDDLLRLLHERGLDPDAVRLTMTEQHAYQILFYDAHFFLAHSVVLQLPKGSPERAAMVEERDTYKTRRNEVLDKYGKKAE